MAVEGGKRARKPNWTNGEIQTLLQELVVEAPVLFAALSPQITAKTKNALWQKISVRVSAVGNSNRTADEVKLKWRGLKKDCIEKDNDAKQTGGGKGLRARFIPFEDLVRNVIGENSTLFDGIQVSGCDSSCFGTQSNASDSVTQSRESNASDSGRQSRESNASDSGRQSRQSNASDSGPNFPSLSSEIQDHWRELDPIYTIPDDPEVRTSTAVKGRTLLTPLTSAAVPASQEPSTSTPARKRGMKRRFVDQRKTPAGKKADEESVLWIDFLKSEISRNNLMVSKMEQEMKDAKDRNIREVKEFDMKMKLYQHVLGQPQKSDPLDVPCATLLL